MIRTPKANHDFNHGHHDISITAKKYTFPYKLLPALYFGWFPESPSALNLTEKNDDKIEAVSQQSYQFHQILPEAVF